MSVKEIKGLQLKKAVVAKDGYIKGYASRFGEVDSYGDVVMKGAFAESLKKADVKMLYQHDAANPIGVWTALKEDNIGLYVEGKIATKNSKANDVFELVKAGVFNGLSIGFRTKADEEQDGVRYLKEIDLMEISLVTFPALKTATIESVKSDLTNIKKIVETTLRDAGLSSRKAKAAASGAAKELNQPTSGGSRDAASMQIRQIVKNTLSEAGQT